MSICKTSERFISMIVYKNIINIVKNIINIIKKDENYINRFLYNLYIK